MKKLQYPYIEFKDVLDYCKKGIGLIKFKDRIDGGYAELCEIIELYKTNAKIAQLSNFTPISIDCDEDKSILGDLSKKDFINLYELYLRGKDKPARNIYDKLLLAAGEKCPFCGGIGRPRNLDHFLPKARFPQFSIAPLNLIPSCRDCNMDGKGNDYPTIPAEQFIHPYLDDEKFFNQKWVDAYLVENEPCVVDFFTNVPETWGGIAKQRLEKHFRVFDLKNRYSIQSGEELSVVIDQRKGFMKNFSPHDFSSYLASVSVSTDLFINHWKRVMYDCLSKNTWFCERDF